MYRTCYGEVFRGKANIFITVIIHPLNLQEANAKDWQGSDDTALIQLQ